MRKLDKLSELSSFVFGLELCQPEKMVVKAKPFKTCSFGEGNRAEDEAHGIRGPGSCLGREIRDRPTWLKSSVCQTSQMKLWFDRRRRLSQSARRV